MLITLSSSCVIVSLSTFPAHLRCHHRRPPLEIFSSNDAGHLLCSREETMKRHSLSLAGTMAALTIKKSHLTLPLSLKAHPAMLEETTMTGCCGHGLLATGAKRTAGYMSLGASVCNGSCLAYSQNGHTVPGMSNSYRPDKASGKMFSLGTYFMVKSNPDSFSIQHPC